MDAQTHEPVLTYFIRTTMDEDTLPKSKRKRLLTFEETETMDALADAVK